MLELIIILVALACAPYMLARALRLPDPPSPRAIWAVVGPIVLGVLGIVGYGCKRLIAYNWQPSPDDRPRWLSNVSVLSSDEDEAENRTDGRTAVGPSELETAIKAKRLDVIRAITIDTLVQAGADVATVRQLLKGSNDVIGAEVTEARERLGIIPLDRTLLVRDSKGQREIAF